MSKVSQKFKGKSTWERARTRSSRLVGLMALLIAATTQSNWVLRHEPLVVFLYPLGLVIVAVAASGRTWCSFYLSGRKDSVWTIYGPYSLCRNPLYFFSGLGVIGVGLCTETLVFSALMLAIFAIYYPGIIRREEVRLGEMFGEAYF